MRRPEVLAPAGDMEKLRFAVAYGADAVYLAGKDGAFQTLTLGELLPHSFSAAEHMV